MNTQPDDTKCAFFSMLPRFCKKRYTYGRLARLSETPPHHAAAIAFGRSSANLADKQCILCLQNAEIP